MTLTPLWKPPALLTMLATVGLLGLTADEERGWPSPAA